MEFGPPYTALYCAAMNGHAACLEMLIANGSDVASRNSENANTALHVATEGGHTDCVALLLDNDADTEAKNKWEQTALHKAAEAAALHPQRHCLECLKLLLAKGSDIEAKKVGGKTALDIAKAYNPKMRNAECVALLEAAAAAKRLRDTTNEDEDDVTLKSAACNGDGASE